jgi:hypothetical protein
MRRFAAVLALAGALVLASAAVAPAATTSAVSGSGSGTATVTFGVPPGSPPGAFDTQVDQGTYTSTGVLGSGTYRIDAFVSIAGSDVAFSGTATLTRSDGATLSGTMTGTAALVSIDQPDPFQYSLVLTTGTGGLVSAQVQAQGAYTNTQLAGPGSTSDSSFTFTGTVVATATPSSKDACKNGGWHGFTDQNGQPFRNQGQCVSWAVHHTR